jgi:predicted nucleic acid-binding protein
VSRLVVLDTGPLGMLSNPKVTPENLRIQQWVDRLLAAGTEVVIPEVADYEVRRELIRARKARGLARLDDLKDRLDYLPITTAAMLRAAALWAQARGQGVPTADDKALDADVILATQALLAGGEGDEVIVATTNVGHLARFVDAREWSAIA